MGFPARGPSPAVRHPRGRPAAPMPARRPICRECRPLGRAWFMIAKDKQRLIRCFSYVEDAGGLLPLLADWPWSGQGAAFWPCGTRDQGRSGLVAPGARIVLALRHPRPDFAGPGALGDTSTVLGALGARMFWPRVPQGRNGAQAGRRIISHQHRRKDNLSRSWPVRSGTGRAGVLRAVAAGPGLFTGYVVAAGPGWLP
jgi:hypothetical protein